MTRINVGIEPTNLPDELLRKDVGMKVWWEREFDVEDRIIQEKFEGS